MLAEAYNDGLRKAAEIAHFHKRSHYRIASAIEKEIRDALVNRPAPEQT